MCTACTLSALLSQDMKESTSHLFSQESPPHCNKDKISMERIQRTSFTEISP